MFDPNKHESLFQYDYINVDEGKIGYVAEYGYHINSRILRHAKVGISKKQIMWKKQINLKKKS